MTSGLFDSYLKGEARSFFGSHPADAGDRRAAVLRARRPLAADVAEALEAQNARFSASPARDAHLAALRGGAAAVVTGQQAGLFLGPLYTIYKAATAIRVARALAAETGRSVVPVFWLQTEDHDLPEIATCHVSGARGPELALSLPAAAGDRVSIAHRTLPPEVLDRLAALRAEIGNLPRAAEHLDLLARHYQPGAGWGAAFAGVLAELFGVEGLVLIDPRDPALGRAAAPVHARALVQAESIATGLAARSRQLEEAGFEAAVHVRAGSPLSFFHPEWPDGPAGPRFRLDPSPGGFHEAGGSRTHSLESLLAALAAEPLSFSTSALLRPILQDSLLPVAAYVGGPGEIAYFAQLPPVYAAFDLEMPLVVPRARFRVLDERVLRLLGRLHLTADDAARPEAELLAKCQTPRSGDPQPAELAQRLLGSFDEALRDLRPALEAAGPGLDVAIEKTRGTVHRAIGKLEAKYETALLHRDRGLVDEVSRIRRLLYPGGAPQERHYGLASFAAQFGQREFIERVVAAIEPFDFTPRDLS